MTMIVALVAMILVLLGPTHAANLIPTVVEAAVSQGHAQSTSVLSPHGAHKGSGHDHSHDALTYPTSRAACSSPKVGHTYIRLPDTPTGVTYILEPKPKA